MRPLVVGLAALALIAWPGDAASDDELTISIRHDFLSTTHAPDSFEIPENNLVREVELGFWGRWHDAGPRAVAADLGPTAAFVVRDPDGIVVWQKQHVPLCNAFGSGEDPRFEASCDVEWIIFNPPVVFEPGTWTLEYDGMGFTTSKVRVRGFLT